MNNVTYDVITENFDEVSIQLVYESMLDRNISSGDVDGLTLYEIEHKILPGNKLERIIVDGEVVGIFNSGFVDRSCYFEWSLERHITYARIGFIYIHKNHRNKGYASQILKDHVAKYNNYAECCHEDNVESNALLSKHLTFHKRAWIMYRSAYYNVYIKKS